MQVICWTGHVKTKSSQSKIFYGYSQDVSLVRFTSKTDLIDSEQAEDTRQTMLASFFILQECSRRNVMIPRMQ